MTTRQIDLEPLRYDLGYAITRGAADDAPEWDGRTKFVISTDAPDRYDDIVDVATMKFENYRKNPVIPWGHHYDEPPVGKCVEIGVVENRIEGVAEWDQAPENTRGVLVASMFRRKMLSAVSIGFRPGRYVARSQLPKDDRRFKDGGYGVVYYDSDMMEFSPVVIPANTEALAKGLPACKLTAADVEVEVRRVLRALLADDAEARGLIEALALDTIDGADALRQARIAEREAGVLRQVFG